MHAPRGEQQFLVALFAILAVAVSAIPVRHNASHTKPVTLHGGTRLGQSLASHLLLELGEQSRQVQHERLLGAGVEVWLGDIRLSAETSFPTFSSMLFSLSWGLRNH
jgi:hypothetical protein